MNYAFRKIWTSSGSYDTLTPVVGNTYTFDSTKTYSSFDYYMAGNNGFILAGVNGYPEWLEGDTLCVVSYDPANLVHIGNQYFLVATEFKVEYICTSGYDATAAAYFDLSTLVSDRAVGWALAFGDDDDVIGYVTEQQDMSNWVLNVRRSDFDHFAPSIVDEEWIYFWATQLDSVDFFNKLTDQQYIFQYAIYFPDRTAAVKARLTDPYWIDVYNANFPDDQIEVTPTPTPSITVTPFPTDTPSITLTPEQTVTPSVTATPS